jgi:hypothetical protein
MAVMIASLEMPGMDGVAELLAQHIKAEKVA